MVSEKPSDAATEVFWLTAIDSAAAPAVELIFESSCAVTRMPAPVPASVLSVLPFFTRAWVLLRILFRPTEPAPATPMAEPLVELATPPAAPMPTEKIRAHMSASTAIGPWALTVELSITAQTWFASLAVLPPSVLTANDAPIATAAAVLLPEVETAIEIAPAPAMMSESLVARTVTAPPASIVLLRTIAVVSASIWFSEPEPAPATAVPLPCCARPTASAPATVKALTLPDESATTCIEPAAPSCQRTLLIVLPLVDSTSASVSVVILLNASAMPAAIAVALPELPPWAMPTATLPAIAKMFELSVARTSASLVSSFQFALPMKPALVDGKALTRCHSAGLVA